MFSSVLSAAIIGVDAVLVRVEADVSNGLPCFIMVGYATSQVKEAADRVRTALRNAGILLPPKRITINLAPADIRKDGSWFDLPIAAAVLAAMELIPPDALEGVMVAGELGLNGGIQGVSGILPMVLQARESGCRCCVVPRDNYQEGNAVKDVQIIPVDSLEAFITYCRTKEIKAIPNKTKEQERSSTVDFSDVKGQEGVKRAALIAAAGFHNLLLIGPPGTAKTMVAKRISTILPEMTLEEQLEITKVHSVAGLLPKGMGLLKQRPFRAPHHTISAQALAGGGRRPRPGEITLAHRGVLFLDELPEMNKRTLEILRQPMEEREISISRTYGMVRFPAAFMLVTAMNPCQCGYYPDLNRCSCTPTSLAQYGGRVSQPLLDRIDICVEAPVVSYQELQKDLPATTTSAQMRKQVERVRVIQQQRYRDETICFNSELLGEQIARFCPVEKKGQKLLEQAFDKMGLSARAYHRIIRTARTIADLAQSDLILAEHISEAICYRSPEKKFWRI